MSRPGKLNRNDLVHKNYCVFEEISSRAVPSIFYFPLIPILRFKTFHRKSVTKVKNQAFSMDLYLYFDGSVLQNVSTMISIDLWGQQFSKFVIFFSEGFWNQIDSIFWERVLHIFSSAYKKDFRVKISKTSSGMLISTKCPGTFWPNAVQRHFWGGSASILNYKTSKRLGFSLLSLTCDERFWISELELGENKICWEQLSMRSFQKRNTFLWKKYISKNFFGPGHQDFRDFQFWRREPPYKIPHHAQLSSSGYYR